MHIEQHPNRQRTIPSHLSLGLSTTPGPPPARSTRRHMAETADSGACNATAIYAPWAVSPDLWTLRTAERASAWRTAPALADQATGDRDL